MNETGSLCDTWCTCTRRLPVFFETEFSISETEFSIFETEFFIFETQTFICEAEHSAPPEARNPCPPLKGKYLLGRMDEGGGTMRHEEVFVAESP